MSEIKSEFPKEHLYFFEKDGRIFCRTPAAEPVILEGATKNNFLDLGYGVAKVGNTIYALTMGGSQFKEVSVNFTESVDAASFKVFPGSLGIFFEDKNHVYRTYVLWSNLRYAGIKQGESFWATSEIYKVNDVKPGNFQPLEGMYIKTADRVGAFDLNEMEKINWIAGVDANSFRYTHNAQNLSNDKKNVYLYRPNTSDFEVVSLKGEYAGLRFLNARFAKDDKAVYFFDLSTRELTPISQADPKSFAVSALDEIIAKDASAVFLATNIGVYRDTTVDVSSFDALAAGYAWGGIYRDRNGVYSLGDNPNNPPLNLELTKLGDLKSLNCWYFTEQDEVLCFCPNARSFRVVVGADAASFKVDPVREWLGWDKHARYVYHKSSQYVATSTELDIETAGIRRGRDGLEYFDKNAVFEVVTEVNVQSDAATDEGRPALKLKRKQSG